jgi:hypothetical protein
MPFSYYWVMSSAFLPVKFLAIIKWFTSPRYNTSLSACPCPCLVLAPKDRNSCRRVVKPCLHSSDEVCCCSLTDGLLNLNEPYVAVRIYHTKVSAAFRSGRPHHYTALALEPVLQFAFQPRAFLVVSHVLIILLR